MSDLDILKIIVDKIPELPNWEEQPLKKVALGDVWHFENNNSYALEKRQKEYSINSSKL